MTWTWLGLSAWGWLLVALGWALIPLFVKRWRLRIYLVREAEIRRMEVLANSVVVGQYEPCLSCGRPKPVDHICLGCGFCGMVTVADVPPVLLSSDGRGEIPRRLPFPPDSRLVNPAIPAGANEARDSSRRRRA